MTTGGLRFIPAPAGNAVTSGPYQNVTAVHPRACGERLHPLHTMGSPLGSSPRLRGTHEIRNISSHCARFIPAPAGNAHCSRRKSKPLPVHPRACGERKPCDWIGHGQIGSSPRLRGTQHAAPAGFARGRFIPAPAGNAAPSQVEPSADAVHPRACGERLRMVMNVDHSCGSSPRLRGTRDCRRRAGMVARFIPAPAGNALLPSP